MNCKEFKQQLMIDPHSEEKDFVAHRDGCDSCRVEYSKALVLEDKLSEAMQVAPDEDLSEKLLNTFDQQQQIAQRSKSRAWATAAMLFVLTIGGLLAHQVYLKHSLSEFVLGHIDHEIEQLGNTITVSNELLDEYYRTFNSQYLQVLEKVLYVERCWMRTGFGLHLIFQGEQGPVTFLLMPDEPLQNLMSVSSERFAGRIYPLQQGSMAIIGEHGEPVEMFAEAVRMALMN